MELFNAFQYIFTDAAFFWLLLGVASGIFVGAIPGLGGGMLMALTLPLTMKMTDSTHAILLLMGMHVGSVSGGLISSTLLKMPGTPSSLMTTFDGYPMAAKGAPGRAIGLGIGASLIGGLVAGIFLVTLAPPLSKWAVRFGDWEYFTMILMAFVLVAAISQGSMLRGLVSCTIGIMATFPGYNESVGAARLTLGTESLTHGFRLLPVMLGIFVVSQLIKDALTINKKGVSISVAKQSVFPKLKEWKDSVVNLVRSSCIGTWVGILPGVGASISSMVSYGMAKTFSKTPQKFGTGHKEGIVAAEAANNANAGGALVPLITIGIPGAPVDAILLGAMIMHKITPGPQLFEKHGPMVWSLMGGYLIANILMFLIMVFAAKHLAKIIKVNRAYLIPIVFVFCLVGVYSESNSVYDVWVMLAFGVFGFFLDRAKFPLGPLVIGFVLGGMLEQYLRQGLQQSEGSLAPMFTRPISLTFTLVTVFLLAFALYSEYKRRKKEAEMDVDTIE